MNRKQRVLVFTLALAVLLFTGGFAYHQIEQMSLLRTHFRLMKLLVEGDFGQAYGLTTKDYRTTHTLHDFQVNFADIKGDKLFLAKDPSILSLWFDSAEIYAWHEPGFFDLLNGPSFFYRKEEGEWRFTGETKLYLD